MPPRAMLIFSGQGTVAHGPKKTTLPFCLCFPLSTPRHDFDVLSLEDPPGYVPEMYVHGQLGRDMETCNM